ncbi:MAG TPA: hypothetical protein VGO51_03665 [Burkholderiaceae bacterium]|jgi:RNA polymerase sigma-70 factor (ECF subfamily)|nr:hypothetical protein [Burkholderiaceae bacterium]
MLEQNDFFRIMEICPERARQNRANSHDARMAGAETDEICKELNISMSNAWIILYRPRIRLRERLDLNRFGNKRPAKA